MRSESCGVYSSGVARAIVPRAAQDVIHVRSKCGHAS